MLILQGVLRAATVLGGGTNKKTGEVIPARPVLQIETTDNRGLVEVQTITVPAIDGWDKKLGQKINLPACCAFPPRPWRLPSNARCLQQGN